MTQMPEQEEAIFFLLGGKEAAIPAGKTVLEYELEKLTTPDGKRVLAKDIFLRIRGAEKICIIGENGCGKTTLLKQIAEEFCHKVYRLTKEGLRDLRCESRGHTK